MAQIVVTGDLVVDVSLALPPTTFRGHRDVVGTTVAESYPGGAWHLAEMVRLACADRQSDVEIVAPRKPKGRPQNWSPTVAQHAYAVWAQHDQVTGKPSLGKVWRIREFLGCEPAPKDVKPKLDQDPAKPDVLVIDDLGLSFRNTESAWPEALRDGGEPTRIVLKTSLPPDRCKLWRCLLDRFADKVTVVLAASMMQARGAAVSGTFSWDRTIGELREELDQGGSRRDLALLRRVIAYFDLAGAAEITRVSSRGPSAPRDELLPCGQLQRFVFHPAEMEGMYRLRRPGTGFGVGSILAAAVVRHEFEPETYPMFIALGRGLAAARLEHEIGSGAGLDPDADAAHQAVKNTFHPAKDAKEPADLFRCAVPAARFQDTNSGDGWRGLLELTTGEGYEFVAAKAVDVVRRGVGRALHGVPSIRYGNFVTVDREEIERFNAIRNLICAYDQMPREKRPLSIAVFGPPGSGKSFAVKQLARELFGADQEVLEFNLSQIHSTEELHTAFHIVRDASVRGRVPLVFWDEFDTGNKRWLAHFLAPMQDAEFHAGPVVHPLGRAIFVFAGGTAKTFAEFDLSKDNNEDFKNVKGPDFVSRLRGYINIKGVNRQEGQVDVAHLIRRAIILRATLEKDAGHLIDRETGLAAVSGGVIEGFLRVGEYLHGARSLTAIVGMSNLADSRVFGPAQLPSVELLNIHVAPDFPHYVCIEELCAPAIEALARGFHEAWCAQKIEDGWTYGVPRDDNKKIHDRLKPYDALTEAWKEDNRLPARLTRAKLRSVGCRIVSTADALPEHLFTDAEKDQLIRLEHDIWTRDHLLRGYEYAPVTDENLRLHRDVVPFDQVPANDVDLDRVIVESIAPTLKEAGFKIVKAEDPP
jgi:hypothetical protein